MKTFTNEFGMRQREIKGMIRDEAGACQYEHFLIKCITLGAPLTRKMRNHLDKLLLSREEGRGPIMDTPDKIDISRLPFDV